MGNIFSTYGNMLVAAFGQTLILALLGLIFACIIGVIVGALSVQKNLACRIISTVFVDIFRSIPMIVLAFFVYFGVPMLVNAINAASGASFTFSSLQAGIVCLALNAGAYMAEIIRAGIQAVDAGQMEAARSLGMTHFKAMSKVVLPQAIKTMIPSIINQFIITLKDTSILSVIGFPELVNTGKKIQANTMDSFGTWAVVAIFYIVIIIALSKVSKVVEGRLNRDRR